MFSRFGGHSLLPLVRSPLAAAVAVSPRHSISDARLAKMSTASSATPTHTADLSDTPLFRGLFTPELRTLQSLFDRYGYELRLAGGPVRDLLSGQSPNDLDFATTATPNQMKDMFDKEQIRMINEMGEKHGTITARINDAANYEVTTLRIDLLSDGRRPKAIEFTKDWKVDANRRDLTVNSMFLGLDGKLYDFFGGQKDLEARRVAFVGDASVRIQEDYLRILRYFRFYGRIATSPDGGHEPETLEAIRKYASGLAGISGERIWSEWRKILAGNFACPLTLRMLDAGLAQYIGLPLEPNREKFRELDASSREAGIELNPVTKLSALLSSGQEMMDLHNRLKLSGFERDLGLFLIEYRERPDQSLKAYQDVIVDSKGKVKNTTAFVQELLKSSGRPGLAREVAEWEVPVFPVSGNDLVEAGCPKGRLMSVVIGQLRTVWKEADFRATREELMEKLAGIVDNLDTLAVEERGPKSKKQKKSK